MNSSQLYQHLTELAEKLFISVSEQNLSQSGVSVQSGLCKVGDEQIYVMDKQLSLKRKIDLLADSLADFDLENIYLVPALRELMLQRKSRQALSKITKKV